jgi:hypothetical protein
MDDNPPSFILPRRCDKLASCGEVQGGEDDANGQ